jgi:hypothetical protein
MPRRENPMPMTGRELLDTLQAMPEKALELGVMIVHSNGAHGAIERAEVHQYVGYPTLHLVAPLPNEKLKGTHEHATR